MNKIVFMGTSPGFPSKDRACSSFLLSLNSRLYQFDAGEGFAGSALRRRIKYNAIEKIFISHLHPDHITGLFLELQMMYLSLRKKPLDIYVPQEALEGLKRTSDMFYLFEEKFPFRFRFIPLRPNPVYRDKGFSLYAYNNLHLYGNEPLIKKERKPNRMQSYSYMLNVGGRRVLYSGDIKSQADIEALLGDVHTLIVEGLHVDFAALASMCASYRIKRLVLTHLDDKLFNRPERLFKIANAAGVKKLVIARDGMTLRI